MKRKEMRNRKISPNFTVESEKSPEEKLDLKLERIRKRLHKLYLRKFPDLWGRRITRYLTVRIKAAVIRDWLWGEGNIPCSNYNPNGDERMMLLTDNKKEHIGSCKWEWDRDKEKWLLQYFELLVEGYSEDDAQRKVICNVSKWFHLDHINGKHSVSTLQNTQILCPNCHGHKTGHQDLGHTNIDRTLKEAKHQKPEEVLRTHQLPLLYEWQKDAPDKMMVRVVEQRANTGKTFTVINSIKSQWLVDSNYEKNWGIHTAPKTEILEDNTEELVKHLPDPGTLYVLANSCRHKVPKDDWASQVNVEFFKESLLKDPEFIKKLKRYKNVQFMISAQGFRNLVYYLDGIINTLDLGSDKRLCISGSLDEVHEFFHTSVSLNMKKSMNKTPSQFPKKFGNILLNMKGIIDNNPFVNARIVGLSGTASGEQLGWCRIGNTDFTEIFELKIGMDDIDYKDHDDKKINIRMIDNVYGNMERNLYEGEHGKNLFNSHGVALFFCATNRSKNPLTMKQSQVLKLYGKLAWDEYKSIKKKNDAEALAAFVEDLKHSLVVTVKSDGNYEYTLYDLMMGVKNNKQMKNISKNETGSPGNTYIAEKHEKGFSVRAIVAIQMLTCGWNCDAITDIIWCRESTERHGELYIAMKQALMRISRNNDPLYPEGNVYFCDPLHNLASIAEVSEYLLKCQPGRSEETKDEKFNREMQKCIDEMTKVHESKSRDWHALEERIRIAYIRLIYSFASIARIRYPKGYSNYTQKEYLPSPDHLLYKLSTIKSRGEIRNVCVSIEEERYHKGRDFSEEETRTIFTKWMNEHYPSILA